MGKVSTHSIVVAISTIIFVCLNLRSPYGVLQGCLSKPLILVKTTIDDFYHYFNMFSWGLSMPCPTEWRVCKYNCFICCYAQEWTSIKVLTMCLTYLCKHMHTCISCPRWCSCREQLYEKLLVQKCVSITKCTGKYTDTTTKINIMSRGKTLPPHWLP